MTLSGRTAVVTGGASGIGRACALRLAAEGAAVVVLDRDEGAAKEVAAQAGGRAIGIDLTDLAAIDAVEAAAFGDHAAMVVPLVHELRRTGAARLELVAQDGPEIVGHVLLSRGWVDAAARLVTVRVLSPLAVLPSRQRSGVGRALVAAALQDSDEAGVPAVFLEGDPGYYGRSGFVGGTAAGFTRPSVRIPDAGFQVHLLGPHEPWMTGALVYPDAFWALDAAGLR